MNASINASLSLLKLIYASIHACLNPCLSLTMADPVKGCLNFSVKTAYSMTALWRLTSPGAGFL